MASPMSPSVGINVVHLFWKLPADAANSGETLTSMITDAVRSAGHAETDVVVAAMLGHKADLCTMLLGPDQWAIRRFQSSLAQGGLDLVDSYVSITEVSEYAKGIPEDAQKMRLYPEMPPEDKFAFCFYPMSKRRNETDNWYRLDFDRRKELMYEHGASGRQFAGRIVQLITSSTGLDDYEWGVTLFGHTPDDVKDVVYTMRFDEASAVYAEFGPFYVGMICSPETVLAEMGIDGP